MPNSPEKSLTVQERLGRKRFPSGIEFEKQVLNVARSIQQRLLDSMPSNYPKDQNTNLAETFLAIGEEFARLRYSTSQVNEDRYHTGTRSEYLYEILGDTLFLDQRSINTLISDEAYRDYLIKVRNAYYGGGRKDNIESSVSDIIGLPVELKELYLDLRRSDSFYTLKDTHTMFFDILMDNVTSTSSIGLLLESVKFFIDLIKPAHVLYDTRLIWTEQFTNREGKCAPEYINREISEVIYSTDRIYMVTHVISRLYQSDQDDPEETWETGTISSIDSARSIIYLANQRILVVTSSSLLYRRTYSGSEHTDTSIVLANLQAKDIVRYYATIDSVSTSNVIEDDWRYELTIDSIDDTDEVITLTNGEKIVYNEDTLIYTRDGDGEYRILVSGLEPESDPQRVIRFRASRQVTGREFFNTPTQVENNPYKEWDENTEGRPYYQGNVKKVFDSYKGLPEGPAVVVIDGVAKVITVNSQFYKRAGKETYAEYGIYRYNLYINGEFKKQFSIEEPNEPITEDEAKVVFEDVYGYSFTGSNSDYNIDVDITAHMKQATEDTVFEGITGSAEFCDREAECLLSPSYEDTRKYWEYPDIQLASGFVIAGEVTKVVDPPGEYNIAAYFNISSDPNVPAPALLPMLNSQGEIASISDLVVYVDGLQVDDAVTSFDPWTGEIVLNFLPPANTTTRIDYYYADRYPKAWSYTEQIGGAAKSQRLTWPYPLTETGLYNLGGGPQDFQVNQYPIVDQAGNLADASDILVFEGELGATGTVVGAEQTATGDTLIVDGGVSGIEPGDTMVIRAENYLDNTIVFEVVGTTGADKIITDKEFAVDLDPNGYPYEILRFTGAPYGVDDVRPLLGHIHLETGPGATGTYLRFDYHYQYRNRYYAMVPDVPGDTSPYMNMGYMSDTAYGSYAGYTLIPDMGVTGLNEPYYQYNQVGRTGYRYRAFNLSNSSVLNSQDTLKLNGYTKYEGEGSWRNNRHRLDDYDVMFSPEHLTDRDKNIVLNDSYLDKNIPANTQLYPGTPLFVETFSDDAGYRMQSNPIGVSTYTGPTAETHDLPAGFTIVGADESGLVDYEPVCDFEENHRINLYSGLRVVEQDIEGYDGPLSTITEGMRTMPVKTSYIDVYYPNREKRINDYLDYINKVPDEIREGRVKTMRNSPIIKRIEGQWLNLKIGDVLNMLNVPYQRYNQVTDEWETLYKTVSYTVIEIIDYETARLSASFKEATGEYDYELIRERVYAVDVMLNEVNRTLVINGLEGFDYALPPAVLAGFPGYGDTGVHSEIYFADPDPDPYPRSPDNPNITGYPTGDRTTLVTRETGLGPTDLGLIPLTSEVIGADGNPVGTTGIGGFTGPSGAVDLGLTGPTGLVDPRVMEADDKYVIPSGDTGTYLSYSEAEYRVQWRNWDQELLIITFGSATGPNAGVILEDPMGLFDDLAEGIKRSYWNVSTESLTESFYFGTLIETSEITVPSVNVTLYPNAVIALTEEQAEAIAASSNPKGDFPWLDPLVTTYDLRRLIAREILHDNSVKVTEIQELQPVS